MLDFDDCVAFHGHACPGLAIGYQAYVAARALLELARDVDEELVCVAETDACGVDAIQVMAGCTVGKGNLIVRQRGKQAFTFARRADGAAVRLWLKDMPDMDKGEKLKYLLSKDARELFAASAPGHAAPERARIFASRKCEKCGEATAENMLRLEEGALLCLDCFRPYERGALT